MKKFWLSVIFVISLIFISCAKDTPEKLIIGKWESRTYSKEGIRHVLEFTEEGKVFMSNVVKVDYKYEVTGDSLLTISHSDSALIYAFVSTFKIDLEENKFRQENFRHGQSEIIEWSRVGGNRGKSAIIGSWERTIENDLNGTLHIDDDGTARYRVLLKFQEGHYEMNEEGLSMIFHGTGYREQQFDVSKDSLVIHGVKPGQETVYLRVDE